VTRSLSPAFKSRGLRPQLRAQLFKSIVTPTLLFGSETWALTDTEAARLDQAYMSMARLAARAPARLHNGILVKATRQQVAALLCIPTLAQLLDSAKLRFLGHLVRAADYLPPLTTLAPQAFTPRGPHRSLWLDQASRVLASTPLELNDARSQAKWSKACARLLLPSAALPQPNAH
jgi:hypothetical protein